MGPIRVLHVIGRMNAGGAEAMIMNIYRNIDRTKIQFDFVVHTNEQSFYDNEIMQLGGKIYRTERFIVANYFSYKKFWVNFLKKHTEYRIVHGHINSSAFVYLSLAKKYGRLAVVHSHSTGSVGKSLRAYIFRLLTYPLRYIADYFFACSEQAGIARFGTQVVASDRYYVLNNGIDMKLYTFNKEVRREMREKISRWRG